MRANTGTPASKEQAGGNLCDINGIGPTIAKILPKVRIDNCAELAQYLTQHTPEELSELLAEQGVRISPKKIENEHWLGEARKRAGRASVESVIVQRGAETAEGGEETPNPVKRMDGAVYLVEFEREGDHWKVTTYDQGEPDPRIAHHESGIEPTEWADWILRQMGLAPPEAKAGSSPEIEIEILKVQSSVVEQFKKLATEVRFKVSGSERDRAAAACTPFWIYLHTVDVVSKEANVVASQRGDLEPEKDLYSARLEFPIPELGRYELHTLILLPLCLRTTAPYPASTLNVVPWKADTGSQGCA